jgi:Transposase C of IS166 homeodomain
MQSPLRSWSLKPKFQLARYRRPEFGGSSKKLARETEELELAIETLETDQAERFTAASRAIETTVEAHKPARRSLPEDLPKGRQAFRALRLPDLPRRVAPNRRGRDRDPRFAPGRVCWLTSSSPRTTTTCRFIARPRSLARAKVGLETSTSSGWGHRDHRGPPASRIEFRPY